MPLSVPEGPWQSISMDLITDLPKSEGFDLIFVVVDRFSKEAHFIPCKKTCTTRQVADILKEHVWQIYRMPLSVFSDQGPQFTSHFLQGFLDTIGHGPILHV